MNAVRTLVALLTSLPARIAISAGLVALVLASLDWATLADAFERAAWGWFAVATGLVASALLVAAVRWWVLLDAAGLKAARGRTARVYWIGTFANNFLPSGFGGDLVRAWLIAPRGKLLARAFVSVVTDRATALACGLLLGWLGVAIDGDVPGALVGLLGAVTGAALVAAVLVLVAAERRGLEGFVPAPVRPWLAEAYTTLRLYVRDPVMQAKALGLGLAFQAIMVCAVWSMSEALGLDLGFGLLAVVLPLVLIATVLPISVAGFGVREGAFVALLSDVGVSSAEATLLSLMSVTALAIASLPGAFAMAAGGVRPRDAEPHPQP
jgi:glycosyltransferase 2 family protein